MIVATVPWDKVHFAFAHNLHLRTKSAIKTKNPVMYAINL